MLKMRPMTKKCGPGGYRNLRTPVIPTLGTSAPASVGNEATSPPIPAMPRPYGRHAAVHFNIVSCYIVEETMHNSNHNNDNINHDGHKLKTIYKNSYRSILSQNRA
jgi:hypothetical protein